MTNDIITDLAGRIAAGETESQNLPATLQVPDPDVRERVRAAIVEAWNSDSEDGLKNCLPPIEFSDAELDHFATHVIAALPDVFPGGGNNLLAALPLDGREVLEKALVEAGEVWHRFFYPQNSDFIKSCGCLRGTGVPMAMADRLRELMNAVQGRDPHDDPRPLPAIRKLAGEGE